jgi:hypothetical protein
MDSTDSNMDLELIAALLDGRLSGEERARAIKLLADSDEALQVFATALREQQTSQPVVADPVVVPIASRRRRSWVTFVPVAAAAVLAIVLVPTILRRTSQPITGRTYAVQLGSDSRFTARLPAGWDQRGWSVVRGQAERPRVATNKALEDRTEFRLGVRSVDVQVALARGDTARAGRIIDEIVELLRSVELSQGVMDRYTQLRKGLAVDSLAQSIARSSEVERDLRELLRSSSLEFGQWIAAADLAAQTHDAAFFESHGAQFVRSRFGTAGLTPNDTTDLRAIDAHLNPPTDQDLDVVHTILGRVIRRRGE